MVLAHLRAQLFSVPHRANFDNSNDSTRIAQFVRQPPSSLSYPDYPQLRPSNLL